VNLPSKPSKQYREELRNIIIQIMENNNIRPYDADLMNREPVHTSQMVQIRVCKFSKKANEQDHNKLAFVATWSTRCCGQWPMANAHICTFC